MSDRAPAGGGLRVALVCPYSLSRPGGVQSQVLGLARSLTGLGHEVTVCAPVDREEDEPRGVAFVDAGRSTSLPANGSVAPVALSPRSARRALEALRARDVDVVHVHEPFAPGLPYALLTARDVPPMVGTFHRSGASILYSALAPLARPLARRLTIRCAVSEAAAATASSALGGQFEVLYNGIEVDRPDGIEPWPTRGPTVLFLGRHEERKGLSVLLEAWPTVVAAHAADGVGAGAVGGRRRTGDGVAPGAVPRVGDGGVARGRRRVGEGPAVGGGRRVGRALPRG